MARLYGSLNNRFEEGKNYNKDKLIHEGDDLTMYYYSDRTCYWVTKVVDQKHIFVKEYQVCADHSKEGGMGHQDWLYFKTNKEQTEYLSKYFPDREYNGYEHREQEWVYRYNKWQDVTRWNLDNIIEYEKRNGVRPYFTDKELQKLDEGKEVVKYHSLGGKVSFGVKSYYYDWSF